jgi:transcriptional regulator with XRE-family HTH domain
MNSTNGKENEPMKEALSTSNGQSEENVLTTGEVTKTVTTSGLANRGWFANWVRTARGPRSLREFSEVTGCAVGQLSQLETGKSTNPEWSTILRIAEHSEGRCVMPKLEVNLSPVEPAATLATAAEEWRSNPQDPYNINLAVSVALREVARCIGAETLTARANAIAAGDQTDRSNILPSIKPRVWRSKGRNVRMSESADSHWSAPAPTLAAS